MVCFGFSVSALPSTPLPPHPSGRPVAALIPPKPKFFKAPPSIPQGLPPLPAFRRVCRPSQHSVGSAAPPSIPQGLPPLPAATPCPTCRRVCRFALPAFPPRPIPAATACQCAIRGCPMPQLPVPPSIPATANPCCTGKPVRHSCQSRHGQSLLLR